MGDPNEVAALQAAFRAALSTAENLAGIKQRVETLSASEEIAADLLEELSRLSVAHAIASNALRGVIVTMIARRGGETRA